VCVCKGCRLELGHPARNEQATTTSLKRHSQSCEGLKRYLQNHQSSSGHSTLKELFTSELAKSKGKSKLSVDIIREEILKFFISSNVPFIQVNNPHFQRIIEWIIASNHIATSVSISRKTIRADLSRYAQVAKDDLKSTLAKCNSKISLALDCWTSRNCFAFLGMFL